MYAPLEIIVRGGAIPKVHRSAVFMEWFFDAQD